MATNRDIETREDIEQFIKAFYEKVKSDATIGIIFTQIVQMDWEHHIPVIVNFWESILHNNPVYSRNAMAVHYDLNKKFPLRQQHFDAWLKLFNETLNEMFAGPVVELAKKRAAGIASLMLYKMNNHSA